MQYREPLPANCPPPDAGQIASPQTIFRVVCSNPPTDDDFHSEFVINPKRKFKSECKARGVSVFAKQIDAEAILKFSRYKKVGKICQVKLQQGAGAILCTGNKSHRTWWPLSDFNILAHCRVK